MKTVSWSAQVKDEIRGLFVGLNLVEKKNKLLMQILFQKSAGLPTTGFFFNEHRGGVPLLTPATVFIKCCRVKRRWRELFMKIKNQHCHWVHPCS